MTIPTDPVLDDIRYHSLRAERHLALIAQFLTNEDVADSLPAHLLPHLATISGVGRALDTSLQEIRRIAEGRPHEAINDTRKLPF